MESHPDSSLAELDDDTSPEFPSVFGKYVLLRPMARGGMGELFLAAAGEVGGFEKLCVVKKVLQNLLDAGVRRRFLDEVKVVVRLNHANLVQVFDAGRVDQDYYLAMELVEGKDLRALWNRCAKLHRRIPVDLGMFVVRELCRGLAYVHDVGSLDLVHRDISPPNILVGYRGEVKVTDFGLAKHAIKREFTSPGVVYGRYSYLSPEQARGLPADRRSDVYAAGIVLWELLTGRQLFPAGGLDGRGPALSVLQHPEIQVPSEIVPGIPEGLDDVVLRALAPEREERYQTAEEFRQALSEVLNRHYPNCDVDRVAAFMRDIFAREVKLETQEYAKFVRTDFSDVRMRGDRVDTLSITDAFGINESQSVPLSDSDIHELDARPQRRAWDQAPSQESLERAARERIDMVVGQRYRIERLLGVGGMGAVYEAKHLALGKTYALKILHDIYGRDPDIIDRFMREARAATQTGHPNIIDVTDIGTMETGDLYFVMELLDGTPLSSLVAQDGPLDARRAVHIAAQICRALGAAHEAGIIHRDLKSENVVLTARGQDADFVKVLDFGICRQVDAANSARTTPGMVMGSPDYMAPEQAAGISATSASDVYALGTILFEMLTTRLPFSGRNAIDVLMQKAARTAPRIEEFRPELPVALSDVVARCLEREPALRIKSMRELEYELTRAIDGRASAVAAMIGLALPEDGEDDEASYASQAAMSRAGMSLRHGGVEPAAASQAAMSHVATLAAADDDPETEVYAVQGETSAAVPAKTIEQQADAYARRRRIVMALRHAVLVAIGGGVVIGSWLWFAGDDDVSESPLPAATSTSAPLDSPILAPNHDEPSAVERDEAIDRGVERAADTSAELVEAAKRALANEHWQEPAKGSLALALANLALVDPGNESLTKLRREAEKTLKPRGDKAFDAEQWETAAASYRDLLRVWPEHDVRGDLIAALRKHGWQKRRQRDYEASLSAADELLNLQADDFAALKLRADSLAGLERWEHATAAYREAMRVRPSSKDVRKSYWRARKRSKRSE